MLAVGLCLFQLNKTQVFTMKYMGSKARLSAKILDVMDVSGRDYIEPFAGGMNMIAAVGGANSRHANELNRYVVAMFEMLVSGWIPPHITREDYSESRQLVGSDHVIGWAGVACIPQIIDFKHHARRRNRNTCFIC